MFEIQDLKWVIAISQHRSLRQAATMLGVRESTLSRRLRDIEHRVGAVLFERSNAGTSLTTVGHEFLEIAHRLVADSEIAFARLRSSHKGESGLLTLGIYTALSAGNFRATLIEHQRNYTNVKIRTVDGSRQHLFLGLNTGIIDVAIVTAVGARWPDRTLPLWSERVVAALPEHYPLGTNGDLHWNDLRDIPLIFTLRDPGPEFLDIFRSKLGDIDVQYITSHEVSLDRLLSLVGAGFGATLVAEGAVGAAYAGVAYRDIRDEYGSTRLHFMACWRQANRNPALAPFLAILRERYPDISVSGCAAEN